ncbi:MAG: glycosyltransferase family 4 protein, partial [Deltaproteobacteria bacterium]|nr:glycosyltransferase family 4 protein [Deltaproteobacteria bacterium]
FSNAVFVCTNFLKGKYGGTKLYHGVDTEVFNPKGKNKSRLREKWGVPLDKKIVLFAGTPRPHKGLDDLIRALNSIDPNCRVKLLLVGGSIEGSIDGELYELSKKRIIYLGYQPHGLMPEILCLSDLVVLPQKDNLISRAQVPGKVFEAMAMAKPIVATAVSDLPEILKDCGVIVKPGEGKDLAHTIRYVLANPNVGRNMGKKARGKCVKLYSFEAMERVLFPVFQQFEKRYEA